MTIAQIVARAHGRAGSGGSWRIERPADDVAELWHYAHRMLVWRISDSSDPDVLDYDIGHGSVSDQGAMNRAFRVLGLPLYFSRAGGASIEDVSARLIAAGVGAPVPAAGVGAVIDRERNLCEAVDPCDGSSRDATATIVPPTSAISRAGAQVTVGQHSTQALRRDSHDPMLSRLACLAARIRHATD